MIHQMLIIKILWRFYRKCRKEPYSSLTIDTTLPTNDPLGFSKNLSLSYKSDGS